MPYEVFEPLDAEDEYYDEMFAAAWDNMFNSGWDFSTPDAADWS